MRSFMGDQSDRSRGRISSDAAWRAAVYRLLCGNPATPRGTAFGIGPRLALTCHHCVDGANTDLGLLLLSSSEVTLPLARVAEVQVPEDPLCNDVAILRMDQDLPAWLGVNSLEPPEEAKLFGFGFPGSNLRQGLVRIEVEPRGFQPAEYADRYRLNTALVLSKDPATRGMSGGPIIEAESGTAVAIIVGGPDYDGRSIALPLCAISTVESRWNAFDQAIAWSVTHTQQRGWAMNARAAADICSRQVAEAITRLTRRETFNAARHVARRAFEESLVDYLSRPMPALLLTGNANVGKTSALAALAHSMMTRSLLLDGFQMDRLRRTLTENVQGEIERFSQAADVDSLPTLCQALRGGANGELVVIVDGLNEAGASATELRTWLSEAINEAEDIGFRLIVSIRTDHTKILEIDESRTVTFDLGVFSDREARAAAKAYGISDLNSDVLKHHPLMFRIAAKAPNARLVFEQGRNKAIMGFVRDMVIRSAGVTALQVDSLVLGCCRVADHGGPDQDSVDRDFAANQLGGLPRLEALIEGGVFKSHNDRVRFSFDEMASALCRPLDADRIALCVLWRRAVDDPAIANRLINSLVACESRGDDDRLSDHVESLVSTFSQVLEIGYTYHNGPGLEPIVSNLVAALPNTRPDISGKIVDSYCEAFVALASEASHDYDYLHSNLERLAAKLQVPWRAQAHLLLRLLPLLSDRGLRAKDLDCGGAEGVLDDAKNPSTVVGALTRLIIDHTSGMRVLLLASLDDRRRLMRDGAANGEVSVGELLRHLLRMTSSSNPAELLELLIARPESQAVNRLLREVAAAHPVIAMECANVHLDSASTITVVKEVIESSLRSAGPGRAPRELVAKLETMLRDATPETRLMAASLLRICDPENLRAWDALAYAATMGSSSLSLRPVPGVRNQQFIDVLRARADEFALEEMYSEDDLTLQEPMAELATEMLPRSSAHTSLGSLAEHKAYKVARHRAFAPWIKYTLNVAALPHPDAKRALLYLFQVDRNALPSWYKELWSALLAGCKDSSFASDMVRRVVSQHEHGDPSLIMELLDAAMQTQPEATLAALSEVAWNAKRLADYDLSGASPPTLVFLLGQVVRRVRLEPVPSWPSSLSDCLPDLALSAFEALHDSGED